MALLNEILGAAARLNQGLTRRFNISGGAPAPQLTPEIQVTAPLPFGTEDYWSQRENRFAAGGQISPTALTTNAIQLRNPAGSGMLVIVESFHIISTVDNVVCSIQCGNIGTDLAVVQGTVFARDTRIIGSSGLVASVAILSTQNTSPGGTAGGEEFLLTTKSVPCDEKSEYVIAPGGRWLAFFDTINIGTVYGLTWRERVATNGELLL